jgi:hypothetical protein
MTMTYTSLTDQILSYLNRSDADTIAQVPNFIYQAEQRISIEVPSLLVENYFTNALTPTKNVYLKPAIWKNDISFQIGTGNNLNTRVTIFLRTYDYLRAYWPDDSQIGQPVYYADYGYDHFIVAPTPDLAYPFELGSITLPIPIGPSVSTNTLTNNAPNLLFFACMVEATTYIKKYQDISTYQARYEEAKNGIISQDKRNYQDRQSNRMAD